MNHIEFVDALQQIPYEIIKVGPDSQEGFWSDSDSVQVVPLRQESTELSDVDDPLAQLVSAYDLSDM